MYIANQASKEKPMRCSRTTPSELSDRHHGRVFIRHGTATTAINSATRKLTYPTGPSRDNAHLLMKRPDLIDYLRSDLKTILSSGAGKMRENCLSVVSRVSLSLDEDLVFWLYPEVRAKAKQHQRQLQNCVSL
jgi:hypothetical protein